MIKVIFKPVILQPNNYLFSHGADGVKSYYNFSYHLKYGEIKKNHLSKIFYDKNFVNLDDSNNYYNSLFENMPKSKDITNTNIYERGGRSYIQRPFHRLIYQIQRWIN